MIQSNNRHTVVNCSFRSFFEFHTFPFDSRESEDVNLLFVSSQTLMYAYWHCLLSKWPETSPSLITFCKSFARGRIQVFPEWHSHHSHTRNLENSCRHAYVLPVVQLYTIHSLCRPTYLYIINCVHDIQQCCMDCSQKTSNSIRDFPAAKGLGPIIHSVNLLNTD